MKRFWDKVKFDNANQWLMLNIIVKKGEIHEA